jgi:arsenate reductase (thioredoxin)
MRSISKVVVVLSLAVAFGRLATAQSIAATRSHPPTQVVFVCEHGSVKSLVAMEYFNRRSQERGLPYRAVARGIAPEATVPAVVREGLHADGFDVYGFVPRLLSASDVDDVTFVVSFDEDIAKTVGGRAPYVKWDDLPGVLANYARGRDAIVSQVDALIEALAPKGLP